LGGEWEEQRDRGERKKKKRKKRVHRRLCCSRKRKKGKGDPVSRTRGEKRKGVVHFSSQKGGDFTYMHQGREGGKKALSGGEGGSNPLKGEKKAG